MRDISLYNKAIFLSGDGDFHILLQYLIAQGKEVKVIANGKRTAKEIRILIGPNFTPIQSLQKILRYKKG